jgi:hypothetical protein
MSQVTQTHNFHPSSVSFSKLRKNKSGGKGVYLQCDNKKLLLQLPWMRSPFGLSSYTDETTGRTSYSLDLSFDENNEGAQALKQKLQELDTLIVDTVAANSKEWLGKEFAKEVLQQALYKPLVRPGKEEYPSTLKLKVLTDRDGGFVPEAYSMKRETISLDSIEKGQRVMALVDVNQIWFIDNKFGVTLRLQQLMADRSEKLKRFAFEGPDVPPMSTEEEEEEVEVEVDDDNMSEEMVDEE